MYCKVNYRTIGFFILLNFIFVSKSESKKAITFEMAKKIYSETCSVCHSEQGNGKTHAASALKPKPRDFTNPVVIEKLTEEMMIRTITDGNPGTAMVSWKYNLSLLEIKAVVKYIRTVFMKQGTFPEIGVLLENKTSAKFETVLKHDLNEGKKIYLKNCFPCHGKNGDGKGPRHGFIFPPPRKFTDNYDMKGIDRNRMILSVTKGREGSQMMAWEGILTSKQINNVVEYIIKEFVEK